LRKGSGRGESSEHNGGEQNLLRHGITPEIKARACCPLLNKRAITPVVSKQL
jgi:hypothetical protein